MGFRGVVSQKIERSEVKEGDHIYTWRAAFTYSHHGIYIGGGQVVHFTQQGTEPLRFGSSSSSSSTSSDWFISSLSNFSSIFASFQSSKGCRDECLVKNCGKPKKSGSGVILSCLDCFLSGGTLYLFKYEVSRLFLVVKLRGGTCTMAPEDDPEDVLYRAMYLLENGFAKYDLINNNCEDFALYCKTGLLSSSNEAKGMSSQANVLRGSPDSEKKCPDKGFFAKYNEKRVLYDLGVRQDVAKVPVEEMASLLEENKRRQHANIQGCIIM